MNYRKTAAPCEVCKGRVSHTGSESGFIVGRKPSGISRLVHNHCRRKWNEEKGNIMSRWVEKSHPTTVAHLPPEPKKRAIYRQRVHPDLITLLARRLAYADHGMNAVSLYRWIAEEHAHLLRSQPEKPALSLSGFRKAVRRAEGLRKTIAPEMVLRPENVAPAPSETPPEPLQHTTALVEAPPTGLDLTTEEMLLLTTNILEALANHGKKDVVRAVFDLVRSELK